MNQSLKNLIIALTRFDELIGNTDFSKPSPISEALTTPVEENAPSLSEADALRDWVAQIGNGRFRLQVRTTERKIPAWLFCRIEPVQSPGYSMILERLYKSPAYPIRDPRFTPLSLGGVEVLHLDLSDLRERTGNYFADAADETLIALGTGALGAGLHEDQALVRYLDRAFSLPSLLGATQFLYFCQSADMVGLRNRGVDRELLFFDRVYKRPMMIFALSQLEKLQGSHLDRIGERAAPYFQELQKCMRQFLDCEIKWNGQSASLSNVVFANLFRLPMIAKSLEGQNLFQQAKRRIESSALALSTKALQDLFVMIK